MIDLTGLRILVVDDDADTRDQVAQGLAEAHAKVFTADSGDQAIAVLRSHGLDVIVSDINMPGCDGYHLMRMVRSRSRAAGGSTPAIALTGYNRPEDHTRALLAGYQVHLVKPVELDELMREITELVARRPAIAAEIEDAAPLLLVS